MQAAKEESSGRPTQLLSLPSIKMTVQEGHLQQCNSDTWV